MNKRYLTALLVAFAGLDLALTFWQNYQLPLDGDLVAIVLPAPWYSQVLHDPFGWAVLTKNEVYGATNRFFAHAAMGLYWKTVPLLLQRVVAPISSLYAASALFTTATQALLVGLLATYVGRANGGGRGAWGFWVAVALLVPLFQTIGYNEQMGVTNRAVTYTFFYAFPMALLLVLLWPFYRAACDRQPLRLGLGAALLLVGLMVVLAFNGTVATATIAVVLFGVAGQRAWGRWRAAPPRLAWQTLVGGWLSWQAVGLLGLLAGLCLYSIYIGRNNSENTHDHTLAELYQLLPRGVLSQLSGKLGLPVLVALVLVNGQLVRRCVAPSPVRQRVLVALRWVGLFAAAYVLLLPLGGYRSYRPYLLRNDSILPILLALIFAYGLSSHFLLFQLPGRLRTRYLVWACAVGALFTYADRKLTVPSNNDCERWGLDQLARAPEPVVQLSPACPVLAWTPILDPNQSEYHAKMLKYWNVTAVEKRYYHK